MSLLAEKYARDSIANIALLIYQQRLWKPEILREAWKIH